jgi:hypothetical protein
MTTSSLLGDIEFFSPLKKLIVAKVELSMMFTKPVFSKLSSTIIMEEITLNELEFCIFFN